MRMLASRWIADLERLAVLPSVCLWIDGRRRDVRAISFFLGAIDAESLVACIDHGWVALTVGSEPHHQLRDSKRQSLINVGVPGVPCFAICPDQLFHEFFLGHFRYPWRKKLARLDLVDMTMSKGFFFGR